MPEKDISRKDRIKERAKQQAKERAAQKTRRAVIALDRRAPVMELGKEFLRKIFPDHWSFFLGELALYSFVILVLTGIYLTMFFKPDLHTVIYHGAYKPLDGQRVSIAYKSALDISFNLPAGLLMRQIHHWAALLFLAAIAVHMLRIFFTGAFRRPREINWMVGVTMFWLSLLEGFCGYSLPDDLLSGTGVRTAEGIVLSVPIVGTYLQMFIWDGQFPGEHFEQRLYAAHILLIPGLLVALIMVHLIFIVYHKHTQWGGPPQHTNTNVAGDPMFPAFIAKTTGLFFMVFGVLAFMGAVTQINPIWAFGPYEPDRVSTDAQPDWYIGFLEGALRLMPAWEIHFLGHTLVMDVFLSAVVLPLGLFFLLYIYPFVERWLTGDDKEHHLCDRPRNQPTRTALGAYGIAFYTVLLLDGGQDVFAYVFRMSVDWINTLLQVALIVVPVIAFLVTRRACRGLQADDAARLAHGATAGRITRTKGGGYLARRLSLSPKQEREILVRDLPQPWTPTRPGPLRRRDRLRMRLSAWFVGAPVRQPGVAAAGPTLALAVADPDELKEIEGENESSSSS